MAAVVVATGLAYSFWWPAVVDHQSRYWLTPGDLWSTVRDARWVGWGDLSYVYAAPSGLVTLPGFAILLAPVVVAAEALGMSISVPPYFLLRPSAWYLIGPFVLATSVVALVALDGLAARLGAPPRRRAALSVLAAGAIWPGLAMWGHPEDVLALALCAFALSALLEGKLDKAGWLLGGALFFQLFAVLVVPVLLGAAGPRRALRMLWRAAFLPGALAAAVLIPNFHQTWHVLTDQPNFPKIDHPTPWVLLSANLGPGAVSSGPGRLLGFGAAAACGVAAWRKRASPLSLVWLAAVALAARCVFEAVMDPYYLIPAIALALVVSAAQGGPALVLTGAAGAAATVVSYSHADMWAWWSEVTALVLATIAASLLPGFQSLQEGVLPRLRIPRSKRLAPRALPERAS